jgi:hypothetical protein
VLRLATTLVLLVCSTAAGLLLVVPPAMAAGAPPRRSLPSVVDSRLREAADALARGADPLILRAPAAPVAPGSRARRPLPGGALRPYVRPDGHLQVHVRVQPGADPEAFADSLRAQGAEVQRVRPDDGVIQALVAPEGLDRLAGDRRVAAVRPPLYAFPQVGSVITEGDTTPAGTCPATGPGCGAINAVEARTKLGTGGFSARLGRRIKIGAVSDGVAGLGRSKLSGDLPSDVTVRSFIDAPGNLVQDSACGVIAEGRALLEIIHDLVPDAQLFFAAVETNLDYLAAVAWLRDEAKVDVIVDDIAFFNAGPYNGASDVAQVRTQSVAAGVAYVAAVGNSGQAHHRSPFAADGTTADGSIANRFPNGTTRLLVTVARGAQALVFLQWNGTPFNGAATNFDLIAFDDNRVVDVSVDVQIGRPGDTPTEEVFLDNSQGTAGKTFGIQIEFCGTVTPAGTCNPVPVPSPPPTFEVFIVGGSNFPLAAADLVREGSVPNGPDAANIITVGAVNVSDGTLEPFSSFGPPPPLVPLDVKPTVVGPDGVSTTVDNVPGLGGNGLPFFGTSAAVGHVGAVVAMLLALDPGLRPGANDPFGVLIRSQLAATAVPAVSEPLPNNATGFGRVDAVRAINGIFNGGPVPLLVTTTPVTTDPAFTLGPGQIVTISGVPVVSFVLTNTGTDTVTVLGVTATVRLGGNSVAPGTPGTSGHELADLVRACVVDAASAFRFGCGTFDADDGRLLVVFTSPLPLNSISGPLTLEITYDLNVQRAGTPVIARAQPAGPTSPIRLAGTAGGLLVFAVGVLGVVAGPARSGRSRALLLLVGLLVVSCGGGSSSGVAPAPAPTCPAPTAVEALAASEPIPSGDAVFTLLPLQPGDIIAVDASGQPVVPGSGTASAQTISIPRP